MAYDADTVCETLLSPIMWAEKGDMPDTRRHFERVVMGLQGTGPAPGAVATGGIVKGPLHHIDMTRAASELNM